MSLEILELDRNADKPGPGEIAAYVPEMAIRHIELDLPPLAEMYPYLNSDGDMDIRSAFACFELGAHPVFDWYASRNRLPEMDFFTHFLESGVVAAAIPELKLVLPLTGPAVVYPRMHVPILEFEGRIASDIHFGSYFGSGPTGQPRPKKLSFVEAREMARRFREALFGDRYEDISVWESRLHWSGCYPRGGQLTFFGFDRVGRRVWLFTGTSQV